MDYTTLNNSSLTRNQGIFDKQNAITNAISATFTRLSVVNDKFFCDFGYMFQTGRVALKSNESTIDPLTEHAMSEWKKFYLESCNLQKFELYVNDLRFGMLVVVVSEGKKNIFRGFYKGINKDRTLVIVNDLDNADLKLVTIESLYAPTKLTANVEFSGVNVILNNLDIFHGSVVIQLAIRSLKHANILAKKMMAVAVGFEEDETGLVCPIVDLFVDKDENGEFDVSLNDLIFNEICELWKYDENEDILTGFGSSIDRDGVISVHRIHPVDDSPPSIMEQYLSKLNLEDLKKKYGSVTEEEILRKMGQTVYIAKFERDQALYRAIVRGYAAKKQFIVEYIDYGNLSIVHVDNLIKAKSINPYLEELQPLICKYKMAKIKEIYDDDTASEMIESQQLTLRKLNRKTVDGLDIVVVKLVGDTEDISFSKKFVDMGIASKDSA